MKCVGKPELIRFNTKELVCKIKAKILLLSIVDLLCFSKAIFMK